MKDLMRVLPRMVLPRQYFTLTLALGTVLTLAISSYELWSYYKLSEQELQQTASRVRNFYYQSLVNSLWIRDSRQLQVLVDGIVEFEPVAHVHIEDEYESWEAGVRPLNIEPDLLLPLVYGDDPDPIQIGRFSLSFEWRGVPDDLVSKGLNLLLFNGIKALIMLGFSLALFHMLVSRYVVAIDDHLRGLNPERGVQLLRFPPRSLAKGRNEIDSVVATINILNYRLVESVRELRLHGAQLEQRVVERTQALEKANERALRNERLTAIGTLVGKVSHELRNPLGTIQASLALLQRNRTANPELQKSAYQRIERNIDRCDKLVRELLIYSQVPADPEGWVSLDETVTSIVEEHRLALQDNCELTVNVQSGASVWFIPEQLHRLLSNLINNAADAVGDRENGRIDVSTSLESESAVLSVTDNGCGIPEDVRERIFEPMFSTKPFGFGFGLSVVLQVVQSSEAEIQVEHLNQGARFVVRFNRGMSGVLG
ncbi:MAG: sensor histidine kinase [Granulosicoccaceae bacterium]